MIWDTQLKRDRLIVKRFCRKFSSKVIWGMISLRGRGAIKGGETMPVSFKGAHFPQDIILMGVRWYVAYPLSYRHVEELMQERGVGVDHATIQRWVVKYSPPLEEAFHRRKRPVGRRWRMDETYIRARGNGGISIAPSISRARRLTFC